MNPEDEAEEDGANVDLDSQRKGKCVVLKTSTRQVSHFFHISADYDMRILLEKPFTSILLQHALP